MPVGNTNSVDSGRRFERFSVDVSIHIATEAGATSFGRTHDISCRGMSIYLALDLDLGAPLRVKFTLPNSRMELNLQAVIKNRVGFRYGIEFVKAAKAETDEITRVAAILSLTQS